jgi:adenylate cyclase
VVGRVALCDYGRMNDRLDPYRFRDKPYLTGREAAEKAGVDYETARRMRRAMGLPEIQDEDVEFDDLDVEALLVLKRLNEWGVPLEDLLDVARVYGQSFARIADAETHVFRERFVQPLLDEGKTIPEVEDELAPMVEGLLELLSSSTDYVHRRHLAMALQQLTADSSQSGTELLTVGFVDLVDFSKIADDVHGSGLSELIERFEEVSLSNCLAYGARLVKMIGDAAMFVTPDPDVAARVATSIVEEVAKDDVLAQARAGIDRGDVVPLGGDYFGRPINVAARITSFARPGTTVVSKAALDAMDEKPDVGKVGTHRLKGVGKVSMYKIRSLPRSGDDSES